MKLFSFGLTVGFCSDGDRDEKALDSVGYQPPLPCKGILKDGPILLFREPVFFSTDLSTYSPHSHFTSFLPTNLSLNAQNQNANQVYKKT